MSLVLAAAVIFVCLNVVMYGRKRGWITLSEFGWMTVGLCASTAFELGRRHEVVDTAIFSALAIVNSIMLVCSRTRSTT